MNGRAIVVGVVAFTLVGAEAGICLAMLFRQAPQDWGTVHLEESLPLAITGALVGGALGSGVSAMCIRWPGIVRAVSVVSATALGAATVAPLGWIVGDMGADHRLQDAGMAVGAMLGGVSGLVPGLAQVLLERRRLKQ